jgi:hypothetical protein
MQEAGRMQLRVRSSSLWRVGSALSLGQVEFGMESESEEEQEAPSAAAGVRNFEFMNEGTAHVLPSFPLITGKGRCL